MPKIYSKYDDFVGPRGEVHDESVVCFVDDVGYISMEKQIKSLINAGINLENYRRTEFDYQYGMNADVDSAVVSPEHDPDFMLSVDMPIVAEEYFNGRSPSNPEREGEATAVVNSEAHKEAENNVSSESADTL